MIGAPDEAAPRYISLPFRNNSDTKPSQSGSACALKRIKVRELEGRPMKRVLWVAAVLATVVVLAVVAKRILNKRSNSDPNLVVRRDWYFVQQPAVSLT